jgi:hypothetical protein
MAQKPGFLKRMFRRAAAPLLMAGIITGAGVGAYKEYVPTDMRVTVTGEHWAFLHKGEGFGITKTVYETDKGELTNTINPWMGKFTRGGIEKQVQVGKTYDVRVQGFSFPWFGVYPNIVSAKQAPDAPK